MVEAKVVGTEGVDLVAEPLHGSLARSEEAGR
jgi:ribosomal protein S12 methylthiotransferase